jgi:hypothetical protein
MFRKMNPRHAVCRGILMKQAAMKKIEGKYSGLTAAVMWFSML